jgi:hypothetical protein
MILLTPMTKKESFLNNLRKASISFVMSVSLFDRVGTARLPLDGIQWHLIFKDFFNTCFLKI